MGELTLDGLRLAVEIAASGSFTAAGLSSGFTQSAVSRQVAALESAVGAALFLREARGVSLTPAGAVLVRRAAAVLAEVERTEHELAGLGDQLTGVVRLGAFPAATAVLVPRAVARLRGEHPALEVAVTETSSPVQLRRLRTRRLDVALIGVGAGLESYDLSELQSRLVVHGTLCVAVSSAHRLARRGVVTVAELSGEAWIVGVGSPGDPQFGAWPGLAEARVAHEVRSWPARFGYVAAGLGVCLLPELMVPAVPTGVTVIQVDDPSWAGRRTLALTRPDAGPAATAVAAALHATGGVMQRPPS